MAKIALILFTLLAGAGYFFIDKSAMSFYLKNGYKSSSEFQENITQVKDEVILGFWELPERILVAKRFKAGYFLIQRDPAATYIVGRGKNLLKDSRTVLTNKKFKKNLIKSLNSELGGLYPPANFPEDELIAKGYAKNEFGEWVKASNKMVNSEINTIENALRYQTPNGNNSTNWEQFQDLTLPQGIYNVGGYGFPLYANEKIQNGKVNLFSKGYSHIINLEGIPRKYWDGKNGYYFQQLYHLIKQAARGMLAAGKNGGEWGDIKRIADLDNSEQNNIDYSAVTVKGAKELGKYLFYSVCCANSIDDKQWNIPLNEGVLMIDEESMKNYDWQGGNSYELYGYLTEGIMATAGENYKVFWYAQPIQRWIHGNAVWGVEKLSKSDIEGCFTDQNILMNSPGWKNSKWFVDANGAYSKVPFLSNTEIYQKANGKFVLDKNGRRKFRNENINLNVYKKVETILAIPDDKIRYSIINPKTGQKSYGKEFVEIEVSGTPKIKPEFAKRGFELNSEGSRPYPQYWESETKLWLDGIYRRADGIMADLLMLAKLEKGKWDISKANTKYKLYGEHRPRTEPWTFGGNSVDVREVGESQIFYDTFMLLLSGGQALSSWDDGHYRSELPKKGEKLYGEQKDNVWVYHDDYWGRYHSKLAAVQTVLKPLEGSKSSDWTYVHFYYPFWGQKNSEVISSGIYYKGKFYVFFLNPTLENGEKQSLELKAGNFNTTIELIGHEVYYKVFDLPGNLNPRDFKLVYKTIYGRQVKVNGEVTNKIDEHYE